MAPGVLGLTEHRLSIYYRGVTNSAPTTLAPDVADTGSRLLSSVARLNRWATRQAEFDTPPAQARLLALISEVGPARIGVLAVADHSSQPTMTIQVQRLEAAGLVQRRSDPSDARVALIEITPEGKAALGEVRRARREALGPALASLTPDEVAAINTAIGAIDRMVSAVDDD